MKMNKILLFSLASIVASTLASCGHKQDVKKKDNVNIIMACATIPPVMAALESFKNEDPTYAWIERGKTYPGIDQTNFINLGFDTNTNGNGLVKTGDGAYDGYTPTVNKMKELKEENPNLHFSIYGTDYKVLSSVAAAFEAGLDESHFTIYMVEDGSGTYAYLNKNLIAGKTLEQSNSQYQKDITAAYNLYNQAKENYLVLKTSTYFDQYVAGYPYTFALSTKPNFVHIVQSEIKLRKSLGSLTNSLVGQAYLGEKNAQYKANVSYKSISSCYNALSEEQKNAYLTLVLGQYKEAIDEAVHRTTLDDGVTQVPSKKLIFIGTRMRQSSMGIAPSFTYADLVSSYSALNVKYKDVFSTEADYTAVYNYLMNADNYEEGWKNNPEVVQKIVVSALNHYMGYVFNLKFTYRMYGSTYDIIVKGHPSEVIDDTEKWSYSVEHEGVTYKYNEFMNSLAKFFHNSDSEGKFCKLIPNGIAAENLAYLNYDHVVGGLSSSTYTGYDSNVPVLYMLQDAGSFNSEFKNSQSDSILTERYEEGTLDGKCGNDDVEHTYYNRGTLYKALSDYYTAKAESDVNTHFKDYYLGLYNTALSAAVHGEEVTGYSFNRFGILVNANQ